MELLTLIAIYGPFVDLVIGVIAALYICFMVTVIAVKINSKPRPEKIIARDALKLRRKK